MAIGVMNWVWDHSRSRHGARLVLLAIADCASSDGANAWPSVTELKRKAGLGERAVQTALADLVKLGELEIRYNEGPKGCNRYHVLMPAHTPAESAPPQIMHPPADIAGVQKMRGFESAQVNGQTPADNAPPAESAPPQISTPTPAESAPVTVSEPEDSTSPLKNKDSAGGTQTLFDAGKAKPASKRQRVAGERIPPGFDVDVDMRAWATSKIPGFDIAAETENFIDYWKQRADSGALKADWPATWRTWMRRAAKAPVAPINGSGPKRGHQPYRNPQDQSAYDVGFTDD